MKWGRENIPFGLTFDPRLHEKSLMELYADLDLVDDDVGKTTR